MLDATAGFEQLAALVADAHVDTEALLGGEIVYNLVGEMVHIDDHAGEPGLLEPQDDTLDERLASHLDQRLGHLSNVDLRRFYDSAQGDATLLVSPRQTKRYLLFDAARDCRLMGWTNIDTHEVRSPYADLQVDACEPYAFSGIHVFSPHLFPHFDEMPDRFGIIDFYLRYCERCSIHGYVKRDLRLMDVGKMETIAQAEEFLKTL